MAPGPLEAQATNPGLETKLPYIRDRKRSNLHSASWANQRPRPRTLPYWYTAFLLPLPRSLNFCLEGSAELAPEGGSPFQLNNKSSFVLDHILCFLLSNKHLFFILNMQPVYIFATELGWGWFTHLLNLPPSPQVQVTSGAFTRLAHIVLSPQRPSRSRNYGQK